MKKPTFVISAAALGLIAVALVLGLRPGSDPVAAVQTASVVSADTPSLARLGNQQVSPEELDRKSVV